MFEELESDLRVTAHHLPLFLVRLQASVARCRRDLHLFRYAAAKSPSRSRDKITIRNPHALGAAGVSVRRPSRGPPCSESRVIESHRERVGVAMNVAEPHQKPRSMRVFFPDQFFAGAAGSFVFDDQRRFPVRGS